MTGEIRITTRSQNYYNAIESFKEDMQIYKKLV